MKLSNKMLLGIVLIWAVFLLLVYFGRKLFAIPIFPLYLVLIAILAIGLNYLLFHKVIINRLKKLSQDINTIDLEDNNSVKLISLSGNDEISSLSEKINTLLAYSRKKIFENNSRNLALDKSIDDELIPKEQLIHLAHYDELTSLPSRVFFNEVLNKTINHAHRHKKKLGLLLIDIDRFKNINEAFGRVTGDFILKELANRFTTVLRASDTLARLDGDEFIILLNDIGHAKFASPVAEKILSICSEPIKINEHEYCITGSIGICVYPNDGTSLEDLQKNAVIAMYKAKRSGGGVYQYFTKEMNFEAHEHIQLEAMLRKAIQNNEFVLYYQPKLNLQDGSIVGVEALIRWENPELGLINPSHFIPLAEETGLIMQIGEWALREACRANKAWQQQGYKPISIAVNISPKQFQHQDIAQLVASVLNEVGLDANYLELEITETAVMDNIETVITKLNDINKIGVHISIDDFGTGYTSISYLKKFPVSILKIDQTFIKNIPRNQNDIAITNAIIALAKNLNIKVVAEGVETAEQLQYLADNHCDIVQGYYLSRPLTEQKIIFQFVKLS